MKNALILCLHFLLPGLLALPAVAQIPTVNISSSNMEADEDGQVTASFKVSRSDDVDFSEPLRVSGARSGTASRVSDYTTTVIAGSHPEWSLTIPGGSLSNTVVLTPLLDNLVEGTEFQVFSITPREDYVLGSETEVQIDILDHPVELSIEVVDGDAAEQGQNQGVFRVTRKNGRLDKKLNFQFILSGTATRIQDYSINGVILEPNPSRDSYNLEIPPGAASRNIVVVPVFDEDIEGDEELVITLNPFNEKYLITAPGLDALIITDFVQTVFEDSFETEPINDGP